MTGAATPKRTVEHADRGPRSRDEMAMAVAADIPAGSYVNLGIGLPTRVADYLPPDSGIVSHSENGILGMGPVATGSEVGLDLTNAGKIPVTELPGAAYFHHADSFAMMRGGHLDICVMGAFQVSEHGDLANWHTGSPDAILAVGGAMDLAIGAKDVFVTMTLFDKDGAAKLVPDCTLPLTGRRCVSRVYTELGTFAVGAAGVHVIDTYGATFGFPCQSGLCRGNPRNIHEDHCAGPHHAEGIVHRHQRLCH
jgi:3-oxoadipate CoA-transferase, beta subunit